MSTAKRDFLIDIEKKYQRKWEDEKIFESNAEKQESEKYFTCIPYPYMNGRLHLGHCFTITKAEYASRYQRLKGKNVLFPFAYHCTGMPIKACADKLTYEMATFGCPPNFPDEDDEVQVEETVDFEKDPTAYKKKKGKLEMKFGNTKYQWGIMEGMGIPANEIPKFATTDYWLSYFPPHCMQDLKDMGLSADWRRGFITTEVNPYYDSFVRWHFNTLKERQKIKFGKRYSVFSPKDNQPCMDHDRKTGEGVAPQEYTGIKIKLLIPFPAALSGLFGKKVYLVAATLRPETMYGQTNCFVKDDIEYVAFEAKNNEVYITTMRAARNMAWQELTPDYGKVNVLMKLTGKDLMGAAIKAPRATFDKVYVLPMMGVKANKGTGVVTSVPSDAPDDYATLMDLKNKQPLREKYGIEDHMVDFDPVPIIDVPGFGNLSAVTVCQELKVNSQNEKDKLLLAKEKCYRKGFEEGVMLVGNHAGKNVKVVKPIIKEEMIAAGDAFKYQEPEKEIISRSGDVCVIALCDQWFLEYGEPVWQKKTEGCLKNMECYFDDTRQAFERTIDWLHEHACSRSYGLGTKLPWDEQWLVESLSDSTIYMAYYTVANLLQGDIYGAKSGSLDIKPEDMTHGVWNYIFFKDSPLPETTIPRSKLDVMRNEFQYWYPVDMRSSGKDLVQNHLTYFLYNHTAVWDNEPERWPQSVRANGHLLMDGEKMSKSLGNIISLSEGVQLYSADGMRLALADAGDVLEDANFNTPAANAGILRLYTLIDWIQETVDDLHNLRSGPTNQFYDKIFANDINVAVSQADKHYSNTMFREAMITGFYEFLSARDRYRELSAAGKGMHRGLIKQYIKTQMILLAPVCPHVADYVWREVLKEEGSVVNARWPEYSAPDDSLTKAAAHLMECVHDFRLKLMAYTNPNIKKKGKAVIPNETPNHMTIFVAKDYPKWQEVTLNHLKSNYNPSADLPFPENQVILQQLKTMAEVKPMLKKVMPFVAFVKSQVKEKGPSVLESHLSFIESEVFEQNRGYILRSLDLDSLDICEASSYHDQKLVGDVCPGKPMCKFEKRELDPVDKPSAQVTFVNIQPCTPFFKQSLNIYDTDTIEDIIARLKRADRKLKAKQVEVYRYVDPVKGPRQLLAFDQPMMWNKRKLWRSWRR
ncbi:leucine--tRNA ligase, cytoplasmic-like [Bolinopsis microptera]|uniref:leucine--tRNA ligase, cytoplasmic-like n=1 Tax=Bolinopsis microptera TaxID=2820187 RepID=UPI00307A1F12